mgnify:CR=1 FL=1
MKKQLLTLVFFLLFSSVAFSQDQFLHVSNSISVDSVIANEFVDNYNTDFELLNKKQNRQANQTTSTATYTYYPDGSLKSDSQRGITLILYDSFLSKMKEIQFSNGKIMRFYYNALGASGAVSAVIFSFIVLAPTAQLGFFFIPVPIPAYLFGLIILGIEHYLSRRGNTGIAHDAHFWGSIFGVVFTILMKPQLAIDFIHKIQGVYL